MRTQLGRETAARGSRIVCSLLLLLASSLLAGCGIGASTSGNPSATSNASTTTTLATTSPTSKSADVSWVAPTTNTNGTALTDLAGYRIYYGTNPQALNQTVDVANAGATDYVIANLPQGTWYFAVVAYTNTGLESSPSSVASKTIT